MNRPDSQKARAEPGPIPVILLGAGRSGTKFLRDVFRASPEVAIVPYDVGYVWRFANEHVPHDELLPAMAGERTRRFVRAQLPRLSNLAERPAARFVLEKSVPNSLRPAFVHALLPEARIVHLVRDGRAVVESALRAWQAPPDRAYLLDKLRYFPWANYRYAYWYARNLLRFSFARGGSRPVWGPRYREIEADAANLPLEAVCARQWARCVALAGEQMRALPPDRIFEIRYEDLMRDDAVLEWLCRFIGIADAAPVLAAFRASACTAHLTKWERTLSREQLDLILPHIESGLTRWGYA